MPRRPVGMFLVALFKLSKAILFLALAIGAVNLFDRDLGELFSSLVVKFHVDLENRFVQSIVAGLDLVDNRLLGEIGVVTFGLAGILFTEGFGLLFQQRWAEYMTVFETGLFIPLEVIEIARHPTLTTAIVLAANCGVVGYLIWALMKKPEKYGGEHA